MNAFRSIRGLISSLTMINLTWDWKIWREKIGRCTMWWARKKWEGGLEVRVIVSSFRVLSRQSDWRESIRNEETFTRISNISKNLEWHFFLKFRTFFHIYEKKAKWGEPLLAHIKWRNSFSGTRWALLSPVWTIRYRNVDSYRGQCTH